MFNNTFIKFVIWFVIVLIIAFAIMAVLKMFGAEGVDMSNI